MVLKGVRRFNIGASTLQTLFLDTLSGAREGARTVGEEALSGHGGAGSERGRAEQIAAGQGHLRAGRPPPRARPRRLQAQHCAAEDAVRRVIKAWGQPDRVGRVGGPHWKPDAPPRPPLRQPYNVCSPLRPHQGSKIPPESQPEKAHPQGHDLLNTWEDSASDSILAKVLRARQLSHPTARRSSKPCEKVTVVVRDERRAAQLA